jgi:hypothetical protein
MIILLMSLVFTSAPVAARDMTTKWPFAFIEDFPETAGSLGFETGRRLAVGIFVIFGDVPVQKVVVRNQDTGIVLNASSQENVSNIFAEKSEKPVLYQVMPMPVFDAERHVGVWEAVITDGQGNERIEQIHKLDIAESFPKVAEVRASGDTLTPTITWTAPDIGAIADRCGTNYSLRLLKSIDTQLHRSGELSATEYSIPEGVLNQGDLPETYVRIQYNCTDKNEPDYPIEIRSETFVPLQTLLDNTNK